MTLRAYKVSLYIFASLKIVYIENLMDFTSVPGATVTFIIRFPGPVVYLLDDRFSFY